MLLPELRNMCTPHRALHTVHRTVTSLSRDSMPCATHAVPTVHFTLCISHRAFHCYIIIT